MINQRSLRTHAAAAALLLVFCAGRTAPIFAGQTADELLAKKYAKILGSYALDIEGNTATIEFVVREGALWADSGDGRPAIIKPVNDSLDEFSCDDPQNGHFDFKFQKDEKGEYSKCRIIAQALGLDVVATKIQR